MTIEFHSLTKALEGWFDKPLSQLPKTLHQQAKANCFPWRWDSLSATQRQQMAMRWDYENDPANKEEQEETFKEACELSRMEEDIRTLESMRINTPLERESQQKQLAELRDRLKAAKDQLEQDATAHPQNGKPVSKADIVAHFTVKREADNEVWWTARMRDAKRYKGLVECRKSTGRGGRPSYWSPGLLAGWLVDKHHMTGPQAAHILREHFPDCDNIADMLSEES